MVLAVRDEGDAPAVGRPGRVRIIEAVVRQPDRFPSPGRNDEEIGPAFDDGCIGDQRAVRGPCGLLIRSGVPGQLPWRIRMIDLGHPDVLVPRSVGDEAQASAVPGPGRARAARASRVTARKARRRNGRNAPAWGFMALMFSRPSSIVPLTSPKNTAKTWATRPRGTGQITCLLHVPKACLDSLGSACYLFLCRKT